MVEQRLAEHSGVGPRRKFVGGLLLVATVRLVVLVLEVDRYSMVALVLHRAVVVLLVGLVEVVLLLDIALPRRSG